ncbi:MAG TPA: universal stress protein [Methylomirabilota bacterium]|nr:universal stress protein [Methylomirabilota bacterium]
MYKRVLVPVDGSPLSEGILPFILQIAAPLALEVVLVYVITPIAPQAIEGTKHFTVYDVEARLNEGREYLARVAAKVQGVRVTPEVRRGEPVAEIVAAARDTKADIIAMTTHGRSGFSRLLFGSVAEAVLRQAEIPVLMMRPSKQGVS